MKNLKFEARLKNLEVQFLPRINDGLHYKKQVIRRLLKQLFRFKVPV